MIKRIPVILAVMVFSTAVWAQQAQTKKTNDEYITDLSSSDDVVVITAAKALGDAKEKKAIEPLIKLIKSNPNPQVRISAASSLGRMGVKGDPTTALSEVVQSDEDNSVVYASLLAILNLADFDNPAAAEALEYCEANKSDDEFISDVVRRIRDVMKK